MACGADLRQLCEASAFIASGAIVCQMLARKAGHDATLLPRQMIGTDGKPTMHSNCHALTKKSLLDTALLSSTFCKTHTLQRLEAPAQPASGLSGY